MRFSIVILVIAVFLQCDWVCGAPDTNPLEAVKADQTVKTDENDSVSTLSPLMPIATTPETPVNEGATGDSNTAPEIQPEVSPSNILNRLVEKRAVIQSTDVSLFITQLDLFKNKMKFTVFFT